MIFNKPIWYPNVIVINSYKNNERMLEKISDFFFCIKTEQQLICVVLDHNITAPVATQILLQTSDYTIYKETRITNESFTSQLLNIGATHVYYIVPKPDAYRAAFVNLMDILGNNYPVICFTDAMVSEIDAAATIELNEPIVKKYPNRFTIENLMKKSINFFEKKFIIR